jgi:hypothetical protein
LLIGVGSVIGAWIRPVFASLVGATLLVFAAAVAFFKAVGVVLRIAYGAAWFGWRVVALGLAFALVRPLGWVLWCVVVLFCVTPEAPFAFFSLGLRLCQGRACSLHRTRSSQWGAVGFGGFTRASGGNEFEGDHG